MECVINLHAPNNLRILRYVKSNFSESCGRNFLRRSHNPAMTEDGMEPYRAALRAALAQLIAEGKVANLTDWCRRAGFGDPTVREFLAGRTRSLTLEKYAALATAVGWPVAALLGESVPRSEKERLILEAYQNAPPAGKAALEAQAERERQLRRDNDA